jgi:hypothetical protein
MAFIKLTKSQNIIDNIDKIKTGDLLYIRVPKGLNPVWKKCFVYGSAIGVTETKHSSKYDLHAVYFLVGGMAYVAMFMSKQVKLGYKLTQKQIIGDRTATVLEHNHHTAKRMKLNYIITYKKFMENIYCNGQRQYFGKQGKWKGLDI